jgi:hypothetical protein
LFDVSLSNENIGDVFEPPGVVGVDGVLGVDGELLNLKFFKVNFDLCQELKLKLSNLTFNNVIDKLSGSMP